MNAKTKKVNTSKYSDAVRGGKLKILLPSIKDLKNAVNKDCSKIKQQISKIKKINIFEMNPDDARYFIAQINNLNKIQQKLILVIGNFPKIVKQIENIWSKPIDDIFRDSEDEYRVSDVVEILSFPDGNYEFYDVDDVYKYVGKHMKNTIKYLGKFGCITCGCGEEAEVLDLSHPWASKIYSMTK